MINLMHGANLTDRYDWGGHCIELAKLYISDPDGDNIVGGLLHIILSDKNVTDKDLEFCMDKCVNNGDYLGMAICKFMHAFDQDLRAFVVDSIEC